MKNIIKFNGKLYAPLEEGAHTIQGEIAEVVMKPTAPPEVKCHHDDGKFWRENAHEDFPAWHKKEDKPECPFCAELEPAPKDESSQDKLKVAVEALEKIANWETSEHFGANGNLFSLCREFAEKSLESLRGAV